MLYKSTNIFIILNVLTCPKLPQVAAPRVILSAMGKKKRISVGALSHRRGRRIALASSVLLLTACSSAPKTVAVPESLPAPAAARAPKPTAVSASELGLYRTMEAARAAPTEDELKVVDSSNQLLGMEPNAKVLVNGKRFTLDCIGTVCAIYYRLGVDLAKDFDKYTGNGVNRLYLDLKDKGVIHYDRYPRTGDIVFWDNTWDANGDGDRTNDMHTHAGVVLAVDDDGTIHYVHENLYKGVVVETMNLQKPKDAFDESGKRLNSGMAIATVSGGPKPERNLAGDTFNSFGDALKVKEDFRVASELEAMPALAEADK
jgi:hypothetical protein